MITYWKGKRTGRFCNTSCADSLAEDRRSGCIYPAVKTPVGSYSVEDWSLVSCTCAYCGAEVRGRFFDIPPTWPANKPDSKAWDRLRKAWGAKVA